MDQITTIRTMKVSFLMTLLFFLLLSSSCQYQKHDVTQCILPPQDSLDHWLLSEKIATFMTTLDQEESPISSGLSKHDYLKIIDGQVRAMQRYQDALGRIIDPVEKVEKYYTTPCYAHSVATLASSGYTNDTALIESGMKALDNSCEHLKRQFAPGNHGDFFTWPVVFAFKQFESFADSARYAAWKNAIKNIDPSRFYAFYRKYNLNWNLVHSAGEFLRYKEGFTDRSYIDTCLLMQKKHFTDYGLYNEAGNPLAYDLFARQYMTSILALGYDGAPLNDYKKILWKGAWMSLFMQSPTGELPTGYRSSQHLWNEAEQALLFEIYATQYAKAGDLKTAGVFKRAAMLSLGNIKTWIRPDGSGYIVKNKFSIEKRHAYETYSVHSCYNMLTTSMLALAYDFATDMDEQTCPADLGAYVLPVLEPFHKIFASVKGNYVQYDTRGDQKYNPSGIIRVHLKGAYSWMGPSDGIAGLWNEKGTSIALGPSWQNQEGRWTSLAQQKKQPNDLTILYETPDSVGFRITYVLDQDVRVTESLRVKEKGVIITDRIDGADGLKRISWPIIINDGEFQSDLTLGEQSITIAANGRAVRLKILSDLNVTISIPEKEFIHRNGMAKVGVFEFEGNEITYQLSALNNHKQTP